MSASKRSATVFREYKAVPDDCARALELLLRVSARKEGGPAITALNDAKKESKHVRARSIIPK